MIVTKEGLIILAQKIIMEDYTIEEFDGLPDIDDYLTSRGNGYPIEVKELDHISDAIVAYCGVTKEQAERILITFFQEIRSSMLRGEFVDIKKLGTFFISSPKTTGNVLKVFPVFKANKNITKRMLNAYK